jgi:hypothetical protein
MHESQMHTSNSFVTLTYAPEHLPSNHSIAKREIQNFFKRLRKRTGIKLRYFACGEYGEKNNRPHYHAIIFGYDFPDKYLHTKNNGQLLFRSPTLEKTWKLGHSLIGDVTFESAAYVARYVMKKRKGDMDTVDPKTGKTNREHYMIADKTTGEIHELEPEFCLMSRNPGLGKTWLEKYHSDTDKDFITVNRIKMKLPKFYDNILAMEDEVEMLARKNKRKAKILNNQEEYTRERLDSKAKIQDFKIQKLIRPIETTK